MIVSHARRHFPPACADDENLLGHPSPAFTLLEVLVAVSIVSLLAAVMVPGLSAARGQAQATVCRSNLRQVMLANDYYAQDSFGIYCPGASDILKNLQRWHGARDKVSEPFDSSRGPLVPYLDTQGAIRQCPSFAAREIAEEAGGFERANGGYGYNNAFLGTQSIRRPSGEYQFVTDRAGARVTSVRHPADTLMFADSAFAGARLIEYSFAEPRFQSQYPLFRADPSIHFRHRKSANIGWCDGHVDARRRTFTWSSGLYPSDPGRLDIGWFGDTDDNGPFDLP